MTPPLCPERQEDCIEESCAKYVKIESLGLEGCAPTVQVRVLAIIAGRLDR